MVWFQELGRNQFIFLGSDIMKRIWRADDEKTGYEDLKKDLDRQVRA